MVNFQYNLAYFTTKNALFKPISDLLKYRFFGQNFARTKILPALLKQCSGEAQHPAP
jgi:hypothetical protein